MTSLVEHLRAMARNNSCANCRLLETCAKLSEAEYRAKCTSFFPSIELTRQWRQALRELYALRDVPCETFHALRREQEAAGRRLIAFCEGLAGDRLDQIVILNRPEDCRYPERTHDVLAHLFQHDIHHRGQVHAMLAGTAVAPPQLDEFFLAQDAELRTGDLRVMGLSGR